MRRMLAAVQRSDWVGRFGSRWRLPSVLGAGAVYAVSAALVNATRLALLPLYARFLTQPEYGLYVTLITVVSFLTMLATMGMEAAVVRAYYEGDEVDFPRLLRAAILFLGGANASLLLIAWLTAPWVVPVILGQTGEDLFGWLPVAFLLVWTYPLVSVLLATLQAQRRSVEYGAIQCVRAVVVVVTATVLLVGGAGVLGALLGELLGVVTAIVLLLRRPGLSIHLLRLIRRGRRQRPGESVREELTDLARYLPALLAFGLPLVPHALSTWALAVSDRLVLARVVGPGPLAVYAMGYSVAMGLNFLITAVNIAYVPHFLGIASDTARGSRALRRDTRLFALVGGWVVAVIAILAPEILQLIGGGRYAESAVTMRIVAFAFFLQGFYLLSVLPLFHTKMTAWLPVVSLTAAATNIGLNLVLVPRLGIVAAAVNTAVAYGVLLMGVSAVSRRHYPARLLGPDTVLPVLVVVLVVGVAPLAGLSLRLLVLLVGAAVAYTCVRKSLSVI